MGKLEDISNKSIFEVPERYFEELPLRIQSRIGRSAATPSARPVWQYALRYALPILLAGVILFYTYHSSTHAESILASVETADLVLYLQQEPALTMEDVIENVDFAPADVDAIETEVYDLELGNATPRDIESELNTL